MKERIIGAVIVTAVFAIAYFIGGYVFDVFALLLAILAYRELINIRENTNIPQIMKLVGLVCMSALFISNVSTHSLLFGLSYETLAIVFLCILAPAIFIKKYNTNDAFYLACVTIFMSSIFNLFVNVYNSSNESFLYIIIVACITDVFALFGGRLIGKHKLTKISPKKTIEGSITGTVFATIIGVTYYLTFINSENVLKVILITILLSIVGQVGDIFFSLIKRENDKKDYSNLIVGHGGILDRLDSIIFILITFTFMLQFL